MEESTIWLSWQNSWRCKKTVIKKRRHWTRVQKRGKGMKGLVDKSMGIVTRIAEAWCRRVHFFSFFLCCLFSFPESILKEVSQQLATGWKSQEASLCRSKVRKLPCEVGELEVHLAGRGLWIRDQTSRRVADYEVLRANVGKEPAARTTKLHNAARVFPVR